MQYKKHKRPNHFNFWITGLQKTLARFNDVRQVRAWGESFDSPWPLLSQQRAEQREHLWALGLLRPRLSSPSNSSLALQAGVSWEAENTLRINLMAATGG